MLVSTASLICLRLTHFFRRSGFHREQRRLAYRSPATALATNMHIVMMGWAADLYRAGDTSLQWVLEEGARGEVFAQGHGEAGNDLPLLYSSTRAERVDTVPAPATLRFDLG